MKWVRLSTPLLWYRGSRRRHLNRVIPILAISSIRTFVLNIELVRLLIFIGNNNLELIRSHAFSHIIFNCTSNKEGANALNGLWIMVVIMHIHMNLTISLIIQTDNRAMCDMGMSTIISRSVQITNSLHMCKLYYKSVCAILLQCNAVLEKRRMALEITIIRCV